MLKFLQISDTHLGAKLSGLPAEIANALRQATRDVLTQAFGEVQARGLDLVLMPGDLFEASGIDPCAQLRFIYQLADSVSPVPVVIAPGNHDPYGGSSPYSAETAPGNVVLFKQPGFTSLMTPAGQVTGRAYQEGESYQNLAWAESPSPPPEPRLLLLHASLLHSADGRYHSRAIVPTTQEALQNFGYAYTALGHYHKFHEYTHHGSLAFAAYSGCPQGLGWDEPGAKGYLIGRLEAGGAELEFVAAARHTFSHHVVNLPPEYSGDCAERTARMLESAAGSAGGTGLLSLALDGRWAASRRDELEGLLLQVSSQVMHLRQPDLSGVTFAPKLVAEGESELLDAFLQLCRDGAAAGDTDQQAWELARYLGHRLLSSQGLPEELSQ